MFCDTQESTRGPQETHCQNIVYMSLFPFTNGPFISTDPDVHKNILNRSYASHTRTINRICRVCVCVCTRKGLKVLYLLYVGVGNMFYALGRCKKSLDWIWQWIRMRRYANVCRIILYVLYKGQLLCFFFCMLYSLGRSIACDSC